jgi:hypothetical protein
MITRRLVVAAVVLLVGLGVLAPSPPAQAATCFVDNGGLVYVVSIAATSEGFFSLVGEVLFGATLSYPLTGSAHIRADGNAHVAMLVHSSAPGNLAPFVVQAVLTAPSFNVGSGTFTNMAGNTGSLGFTATACPTVYPQ